MLDYLNYRTGFNVGLPLNVNVDICMETAQLKEVNICLLVLAGPRWRLRIAG